jgi:23S rRNA (guanine2445-N2)-methyltransferase / 23S rRNA (guanine2069-N7)-methyltransferase
MSDPTSPALALFVTCPRGVEPLLAAELVQLGATATKERPGGIACQSDQIGAYRICLWSRLASRVLMPLASFPCPDTDALYAGAKAVDWPELFALDSSFAIEVAGHSAKITHTQYAGLKVKDAIADRFRDAVGERPNVDTEQPDIRVHLHLSGEEATVSLDLAGDSLHRRGYRLRGVEAPLKENLAAAILVRAGWPEIAARGGTLLDPMCGSGTLVLEAALMAADVAPGIARTRWGFEAWLDHRPKVWQDLIAEAKTRRDAGLKKLPPLIGQDIDPRALQAARQNAQRAGFATAIEWKQGDVAEVSAPATPAGLLVTNPPYGERLGTDSEIIKLYSLLGAALKERFGGWRAAVFTARPDFGPRLGLRAEKMYSLYNGALLCKLLLFTVAQQIVDATATTGGEDFSNRLRKNLKHLSKWAKRTDVSCYRLYDADLPDFAVAVDLYACATSMSPQAAASFPRVSEKAQELHVVVQEYAAPKTVDPFRAERRLREALSAIQQILEVPASRLHFKIRKSQKGDAQYTRQSEGSRFFTVEEHGCQLWVNFEDYLDTGLFLDHRPLRLRIQREAEGKRFLNLFCYTASATVHAFKGGAAQSLSVDLSNTYLDWAERNLHANRCKAQRADKFKPLPASPRGHWLLQADCLVWLREQAALAKPPQFDLILLDPPTFSNSKRMEEVLDTQHDHVEMIQSCTKLLAAGGTLYFSTNRRSFKLDQAALGSLQIKDITAQTLDEDFKRPPPSHRCWQIRH